MTALTGLRVVELEAKGPGPFAVMLLADLGADVVRVDRPRREGAPRAPLAALERGRRSVAVNLKDAAGRELLLRLVETADVLVEGYRPGVAERLGFGPDVCLERNPRLVYARATGWGQDGPRARRAAHDINFLALAGALHPIGSADRPPPPPLNLVGDFAGGGAYLVIGVMGALLERERSGLGQIVDAAMVDGVTSLLTAFHALRQAGAWSGEREDNIVDGGAPWYRCYGTADGGYIAVGALEPSFYAVFLERLHLAAEEWPMHDRSQWPRQRTELQRLFGSQPRSHWEALFDGSDACVTPVLSLEESLREPQLIARQSFTRFQDGLVPQAAPRLSRTGPVISPPAPAPGQDTDGVLCELGLSTPELAQLRAAGTIA